MIGGGCDKFEPGQAAARGPRLERQRQASPPSAPSPNTTALMNIAQSGEISPPMRYFLQAVGGARGMKAKEGRNSRLAPSPPEPPPSRCNHASSSKAGQSAWSPRSRPGPPPRHPQTRTTFGSHR